MNRFIVAMLVTASVTGVVSLALAQVAPARYAAMENCIKQAQAQFPDTATGNSQMNARYSVYAACMKAAGQDP